MRPDHVKVFIQIGKIEYKKENERDKLVNFTLYLGQHTYHQTIILYYAIRLRRELSFATIFVEINFSPSPHWDLNLRPVV